MRARATLLVKKQPQKSAEAQVALVTGAARGIGAAVAMRLAREGWTVAINDVDRKGAAAVQKKIVADGGRAIVAVADVSREDLVRRMIARVTAVTGRLDAVINNAGIDRLAPIGETSGRQWKQLLGVDLGGAFFCAKHAEPYLARFESSSIVNIASIHAIATLPSRAAYASAKAGLIGLTKALCVELGPRGIRVNAILPGYIRTEIWREWLDRVDNPERVLADIAQQHPLRRIGRPEDVAALVSFLVSDNARFLSGSAVVLDGGLTATFVPPPI